MVALCRVGFIDPNCLRIFCVRLKVIRFLWINFKEIKLLSLIRLKVSIYNSELSLWLWILALTSFKYVSKIFWFTRNFAKFLERIFLKLFQCAKISLPISFLVVTIWGKIDRNILENIMSMNSHAKRRLKSRTERLSS